MQQHKQKNQNQYQRPTDGDELDKPITDAERASGREKDQNY